MIICRALNRIFSLRFNKKVYVCILVRLRFSVGLRTVSRNRKLLKTDIFAGTKTRTDPEKNVYSFQQKIFECYIFKKSCLFFLIFREICACIIWATSGHRIFGKVGRLESVQFFFRKLGAELKTENRNRT